MNSTSCYNSARPYRASVHEGVIFFFSSHLFLLVELSVVWVTVHCCQPCHRSDSPNGNLSARAASLLTWHPRRPLQCPHHDSLHQCVCTQWDGPERAKKYKRTGQKIIYCNLQYMLLNVFKVKQQGSKMICFHHYFRISCLSRDFSVAWQFFPKNHLWSFSQSTHHFKRFYHSDTMIRMKCHIFMSECWVRLS